MFAIDERGVIIPTELVQCAYCREVRHRTHWKTAEGHAETKRFVADFCRDRGLPETT